MENKQELPQIMKAGDVADYLKISTRRAYEIFDIEGFPRLIIGKSKRVDRDRFLSWLEQQDKLDVS